MWRRCATSLLRCIATASSLGRLGASASAGGGLARTASAMERIAAYCSRSASRTSPPPGGWLTSAGRGRIGPRLGLEALWPSGAAAFGWLTSHVGLALCVVLVWDPVRPANPDLSTWMRAVASTDGFQVMASSPPVARHAPTRRIGTRTQRGWHAVVSHFAQNKTADVGRTGDQVIREKPAFGATKHRQRYINTVSHTSYIDRNSRTLLTKYYSK